MKSFLVDSRQVFILRGRGNRPGKVEDQGDTLRGGTEVRAGRRGHVQARQGRLTSEIGGQGVRMDEKCTELGSRKGSFHLRISSFAVKGIGEGEDCKKGERALARDT